MSALIVILAMYVGAFTHYLLAACLGALALLFYGVHVGLSRARGTESE